MPERDALLWRVAPSGKAEVVTSKGLTTTALLRTLTLTFVPDYNRLRNDLT